MNTWEALISTKVEIEDNEFLAKAMVQYTRSKEYADTDGNRGIDVINGTISCDCIQLYFNNNEINDWELIFKPEHVSKIRKEFNLAMEEV